MEIIRTVSRLSRVVDEARRDGKTIGLVPTMGALHAGHKSLVDRARRENDVVVVSVFVNPTQFNNADDLRTYPRTEEADCAMLEGCGVDFAFVPSPAEVYPEPDTRVFPVVPLTRRFGYLDGSTRGSLSVSSKFGPKLTVSLLMSASISMEILLSRASV